MIKVEKKDMEVPCKYCERKGCGTYHDVCSEYRNFRECRILISQMRLRKTFPDARNHEKRVIGGRK